MPSPKPKGSIVITGASSGIGKACTLRLDRLGYRVYAGVRKEADAEALRRQASQLLTPLIIDVTKPETLKAATQRIDAEVGEAGLAGLVNNAGIAVAAPLEYLPVDELSRQLQVNVVGQVAATQAFLPLIRRGHGRIVNMGSVSGRMAVPLLGPYCASKFAIEALTASLRMELAPWGIHVAIIAPGGIATPIWGKAKQAGDELAKQMPPEAFERYGRAIDYMERIGQDAAQNGTPASKVARAVVHALTSDRPKTRYMIGKSAALREVLLRLPERLRERLILNNIGHK